MRKILERMKRSLSLAIAAIPPLVIMGAWVVHLYGDSLSGSRGGNGPKSGSPLDYRLYEATKAAEKKEWRSAFNSAEIAMKLAPERTPEVFGIFDARALGAFSSEPPNDQNIFPLAVDFEIVSASPMIRYLVLDCWGRVFFQEGGRFHAWSHDGIPGVPDHRAVDMEIIPWKKAAVILRDDGELYEVPTSSWLTRNANRPGETKFEDAPIDRRPKRFASLLSDASETGLSRGRKFVDLLVDYSNRRLVGVNARGEFRTEGDGKPLAAR